MLLTEAPVLAGAGNRRHPAIDTLQPSRTGNGLMGCSATPLSAAAVGAAAAEAAAPAAVAADNYCVTATLTADVVLLLTLLTRVCLHVTSPLSPSWQSAMLGMWYVQVIVLANQIGGFIGSALLPIPKLNYPRTTLLVAACGMFAFVPAYVLALKLHGAPPAFIPLSFLMYLYNGCADGEGVL